MILPLLFMCADQDRLFAFGSVRESMDTTKFRRASHDVWEAMAPGWDERHAYFEEVARPVTARMLERLEPTPGQIILDLAAGTGVVGFAASSLVEPGGRVIVSDFSEAMVKAAASHAARLKLGNVECRTLDAERLDLPDAAVDGVLCRWGYMLMADPAAAVAETRRVLRRGGRLSSAVFSGPKENPWAALPSQVLREGGYIPPPRAGAPGIFALADRDRLSNLFVTAGFSDLAIDEVGFTWRFADADDYWQFVLGAVGAIAMVLNALEVDERERVRVETARRAASFEGENGMEMPGVSLVASGT
jgi:ubiquinone/menaquinone biosynthesis C-methylase UbiE